MAVNELVLATEAVIEVKVHPVVIFQILDRALRRSEEQDRVIGTLLGRVENGVAEITNSFAVPHLENGDEVAVGKDFHTQMYELHQRVNENEIVVGWYATTAEGMSVTTSLVDEHSCLIHEFYGSVAEMPVHLVIDTSLTTDQLQVSAFVSTPLEAAESALVNQFKQIQVTQKVSEPEAIACTFSCIVYIVIMAMAHGWLTHMVVSLSLSMCVCDNSERHGAKGRRRERVTADGASGARGVDRAPLHVPRERRRVRCRRRGRQAAGERQGGP